MYEATTLLTLLQEVAQIQDVKIDWNALVKKTATGISNVREYQMLWRHLSLDGKQNHMLRALPLALVKRSAVIDLESSLSSSENELTRSGSTKTESLEQDTGDSRATAGAFKAEFGGMSADPVNPRIRYCQKCNQPKPPRWEVCAENGPSLCVGCQLCGGIELQVFSSFPG
ncbi:unnamed protein product [Camellia sinensis]